MGKNAFLIVLLITLLAVPLGLAYPTPQTFFDMDNTIGGVGQYNSSENPTSNAVGPVGGVNSGPGHIRQGLYTNGSGYLSPVNNFVPSSQNKTYTFWFYPNSSFIPGVGIDSRFILNVPGSASGAESVFLLYNSTLGVDAGIGAGDAHIRDHTLITNDTWHMGALVFDGAHSRLLLYVDGALSSNISYVMGGTHGNSMYIGAKSDGTYNFGGGFDLVGVWNSTLSSTDIGELYTGGGANSTNFPYTVTQVDTFRNKAVTQITAGFNSTAYGGNTFYYDYSVICDATRQAYWSEQFTPSYHGDFSTSVFNLTDYLSNSGIYVSIPGNVSYFYYEKAVNSAQRSESSLVLSYRMVGNMSIDVVGLTSGGDPDFWYRLNRTGGTISVYRMGVGGGMTLEGSTTGSDNVAFTVDLQPVVQEYAGVVYHGFDRTLTLNNASVGSDGIIDSINAGWDTGNNGNVGDVQLFVNTDGVLYIRSLSFYKTATNQPASVQFVNSYYTTAGNIATYSPPQAYDNETVNNNRIDTEAFSVIPGWVTNQSRTGFTYSQELLYSMIINSVTLGFVNPISLAVQLPQQTSQYTFNGGNNVFYSVCSYSAPGTYTQRHLLKEGNTVDITVTVSNRTTGTTGIPSLFDPEAPNQGAITGANGDDVIEGGLHSLFASAGITSTGGQFMAWVIICLIVAAMLFTIHWILGIGGFVILMIGGVMISLVPVWVVLIFVIICAGLAGLGYRTMVSGS